MATLDERWKKVKSRYFNTEYQAHGDFHHTIRNLLNSSRKLARLLKDKNYTFANDEDNEISANKSDDDGDASIKEKHKSQTP